MWRIKKIYFNGNTKEIAKFILLLILWARKILSERKEFWELNSTIIQYISIFFICLFICTSSYTFCLHRDDRERERKIKRRKDVSSFLSVCMCKLENENNTRFLWLLLRRCRLHFHWLLEFWVNTRKMMNSGDLIWMLRSFWVIRFRANAFIR